MTDTTGTFGGFWDRVTYISANAQVLVFGVFVSLGAAFVYFQPSLPGIPDEFIGMFAITLLFGPALFGFWYWLLELFRKFRWETIFEINAATDTREKWFVKPELWEERETDGPSPYRCNEDTAFEVREFDHDQSMDQVRVRGSHLSQMQDSRLLTFKTLVHDLHEVFAEKWQEKTMARARETRRGLEQQEAVVNSQAEASERGLMEPPNIVAESWQESLEDLRDEDDYLKIEDFESYADQERSSWSSDQIGPEPAPESAATDGGTEQ